MELEKEEENQRMKRWEREKDGDLERAQLKICALEERIRGVETDWEAGNSEKLKLVDQVATLQDIIRDGDKELKETERKLSMQMRLVVSSLKYIHGSFVNVL